MRTYSSRGLLRVSRVDFSRFQIFKVTVKLLFAWKDRKWMLAPFRR